MAELVAGGLRFHVQRLGAGDRTVVFLHGLVMDNLSSWYFTLANPAAASAEVVLFDLRGHGKSERPKSGYGLAAMADDLLGVLDGLGITRPVQLVGNSFGGLLAVYFASRHPERVAALALVDPHLGAKGWGEEMAKTLSLTGEERDRMIMKAFQSWLGRGSERKSSRLAASARALVEGTTLVEDLRRSPELSDAELARIRCPALAIYGEASDLRPHAERLSRLLPRCEVRVYPGCSHSVLWEATAKVRDEVLGWLAGAAA